MTRNITPPQAPAKRLFSHFEAAAYRCISPGTQANERLRDRKRIARGEEPLGPRWVTVNDKPYYEKRDLDAWLDANAVPYGAGPPPVGKHRARKEAA
jgi:hypothetical protein